MNSIGFNQSGADPCVYIRTASTMAIVAVYVDDLILITKTVEEMQEVKKSLAAQFKMKDMGELHYCLGVSIEQDKDRKCLWMHQKQYIQNMLEKHELTEAKTASTLADPNVKLEKDDGVSKGVDQITYQSIVGSLLYAAIATRPDIAQAVGVVSKFNSKPTVMMEHNQGAIAIARNPVAHTRTKHIDIRYHFVREAVQEGTVDLRYCPTNDMLADLLTKSLLRGRFENSRLAMGMDRQTMTAQPVN